MIAAAVTVVCLLECLGGLADSVLTVQDTLAMEIEPGAAMGEDLFEQFESESDDLQPLDDITWRKEHPHDLNRISVEELESLPGVTPSEAITLLEFRRAIKKFTSVQQLRVIEDYGDELYEKLLPYVTVDSKQENVVQFRSRTSQNLQPRQGDLDSSFAGSSLKSYECISIKGGDIEAGALFEKDAGERLSSGFASGYVAVKDLGVLSQVVAGDFIIEAAQGLVLWRGTSFGKGGEAISVARKSALSAQPYRSSGEVNFLRGAAASAVVESGPDKIEATAFFSRRALDANIDSMNAVSGFYNAGLFRTPSELQKRKAVIEQIVGGRVRFISSEAWSLGSTAFRTAFDKAISSDRRYEFSGQEQSIIGFDASMTMERLSVFGEIARSNDKSVAGIAGTILTIGSKSNIALLYRDYGRGFNNYHANGFGERSDTRNERGFYFGIDVRATQWLRLSGHLDQFKFPWQTYFNPLPSGGHELLVQSDAAITKQLDMIARFSHKSVEGSEADVDIYGRDVRPIVVRTQRKYRLTATYKATQSVTVKGRVEATTVDYSLLGRSERGYLFYQDVRCRISKGLSLNGRLVFFDTQSYDSRLYEYEADLRGAFSNPGLYGKGRRWYMMIDCSIAGTFTLSAKYSETEREGVTTISSGLTQIQGPLDNRLSVQIDIRL